MKALDAYFKSHAYDTRPDSDYDADELAMGKKVETEHTDDPMIAQIIAKDHLDEIADYYTRLKDMEDNAKKESKDSQGWDGSIAECVNQIK